MCIQKIYFENPSTEKETLYSSIQANTLVSFFGFFFLFLFYFIFGFSFDGLWRGWEAIRVAVERYSRMANDEEKRDEMKRRRENDNNNHHSPSPLLPPLPLSVKLKTNETKNLPPEPNTQQSKPTNQLFCIYGNVGQIYHLAWQCNSLIWRTERAGWMLKKGGLYFFFLPFSLSSFIQRWWLFGVMLVVLFGIRMLDGYKRDGFCCCCWGLDTQRGYGWVYIWDQSRLVGRYVGWMDEMKKKEENSRENEMREDLVFVSIYLYFFPPFSVG